MPENNLYYIYVDTKIEGAIEQLFRYFQAHVFNSNSCIEVLCKYYKETAPFIIKKFEENNIPYRFIKKNSDLTLQKNKTIFYLFNAQSNCRLVANRDLVHIFVTHGDSHKLASVKPIIRIYDFVISAGQAGIDRFLKMGIFSQDDIDKHKVIALGNTFIGSNNFEYDPLSESVLYAPTWEGGVPEEDYSSISSSTAVKIINFCKNKHFKKIYFQPHPNLGHRLKSKIDSFQEMVSAFRKVKIEVEIIQSNIKEEFSFLPFKKKKSKQSCYKVAYALTDISAMEVQFISKDIPCSVFIKDEHECNLAIPSSLKSYYEKTFIRENDKDITLHLHHQIKESKPYFLSFTNPELETQSYDKRLSWLCAYTHAAIKEQRKTLFNTY